jgi:bacterioferritin-associated ferredoxin
MYVCLCKGVTEARVRQVASAGSTTAETLIDALGLADKQCCGRCARNIQKLVVIAEEATRPARLVPERSHAPYLSLSPA